MIRACNQIFELFDKDLSAFESWDPLKQLKESPKKKEYIASAKKLYDMDDDELHRHMLTNLEAFNKHFENAYQGPRGRGHLRERALANPA